MLHTLVHDIKPLKSLRTLLENYQPIEHAKYIAQQLGRPLTMLNTLLQRCQNHRKH